jgi:hypothetical protein
VLDSTGNADAFTGMPPGPYHGYPGPKKKYDLCCGISVAASDQPTINKVFQLSLVSHILRLLRVLQSIVHAAPCPD